jgi:hypothetical protein
MARKVGLNNQQSKTPLLEDVERALSKRNKSKTLDDISKLKESKSTPVESPII